jgi:hypothetical protein
VLLAVQCARSLLTKTPQIAAQACDQQASPGRRRKHAFCVHVKLNLKRGGEQCSAVLVQCSAAPTCPAAAGRQMRSASRLRRRAPANCGGALNIIFKMGGGRAMQCCALAVQRYAHLPSNVGNQVPFCIAKNAGVLLQTILKGGGSNAVLCACSAALRPPTLQRRQSGALCIAKNTGVLLQTAGALNIKMKGGGAMQCCARAV